MSKIIIDGNHELSGEIKISGAKNSAVALIPAAILAKSKSVIYNVPEISDIEYLIKIMELLNCKIEHKNDALYIDSSKIENKPIPEELSVQMRASYYFMGVLLAKFGKVGLDAGYDVFRDAPLNHGWNNDKDKKDAVLGAVGDDNKIFNVGLKAELGKDVNLGFRYLHASEKVQEADSKNGYVVDLGFKGAKANKPGSWGIAARYMDVGGMIPMAYTDDNSPMTVGADYVLKTLKREGWKGYEVKASYTFAKNIIGTVAYYDWKGKVSDNKNRTFGGHLIMTF